MNKKSMRFRFLPHMQFDLACIKDQHIFLMKTYEATTTLKCERSYC